MSVYFAQRVGTGLIKIGTTSYGCWSARDFDYRCKGVKDLTLLAWVQGGIREEHRFHSYLEPHHVGGEWFEPAERVLACIAQLNGGTFDWSVLPERGWCVIKPYQTKASLAHWGRLPPDFFDKFEALS